MHNYKRGVMHVCGFGGVCAAPCQTATVTIRLSQTLRLGASPGVMDKLFCLRITKLSLFLPTPYSSQAALFTP